MHWQKITILATLASAIFVRPGWSDEASTAPALYSEAFCVKILEEAVEKGRGNGWQLSDRDRHIITQCRQKYPARTNAKTPLPSASDCLEIVHALVKGGINQVKDVELPQERIKSIERCNEVIEYRDLQADRLLPTFKPGERLVIDRTAYRQQSPQRGDAIVFKVATTGDKSDEPVIQRAIGLPGDKVKIERGKVYINGQLLTADYLGRIDPKLTRSIVVPANSYLLLDDNRDRLGKIISRSAIIGKVIWNFKADRVASDRESTNN